VSLGNKVNERMERAAVSATQGDDKRIGTFPRHPGRQTAAQNAGGQAPSRTDAIDVEIPVVVHASRYLLAGRGASDALPPLHEKTHTAIVFPQGGVVRLSANLSVGELIVVTNQRSGADVLCRVKSVKVLGNQNYVGLEFTRRATGFWDQCFVPEPSTRTENPSSERSLPISATVRAIPRPVEQPALRSSFRAEPISPVPAATPPPDFALPAIPVATAFVQPLGTPSVPAVAPPSSRSDLSTSAGLAQSAEWGHHPATGSQQVWGQQSSTVLTLFPGSLIPRSLTLGVANDSLTQRKNEAGGDDQRSNLRVVAFAGLCLLGTLLPFIGHPKLAQGTSSTANLTKVATPTYSADPQDTQSGQLLTVVARSGQTLEDLSLLYTGDFDRDLFEEICRLNPELKDPSHLETGQLIRIPLPPGTLRRVVVRAGGTSTPTLSSSRPGY
jgi:hypothetical protein